MKGYNLNAAELEIHQSSIAGELEKKYESNLSKERYGLNESQIQVQALQEELSKYSRLLDLTNQLRNELQPIFPEILDLVVTNVKASTAGSEKTNVTVIRRLAIVQWKRQPRKEQLINFEKFLRERLKDKDLTIWEDRAF